MTYANDQLLKGYQFDPDNTMVDNVNSSVNNHYLRRLNAQKARDVSENRVGLDYEAKGYKEEGL